MTSLVSLVFCIAALTAINANAIRFTQYDISKALEDDSNLREILASTFVKEMYKKKSEQSKAPWFCHGLDCPAFKVVNKTFAYEVREYEPSNWVSTQKLNMHYDAASGEMFMKLFDYIQGDNELKEKIHMTAPVITRVIPGAGPECESNFTMSFFIPPDVTNPPKPNNTEVYFESLPAQKVYVGSFGGRPYELDWIKHGAMLAAALKEDQLAYNKDYFFTAGYDSPFRLFLRHNEIWFMAE